MRDAVNKAARLLINYCLENGIGRIVFGWNKGQKDGIDIGAKNNQKFVQVPTAKLKERIKQLCEQYGIEFIETEESYTSQASFLDDDFLPTFGAKPSPPVSPPVGGTKGGGKASQTPIISLCQWQFNQCGLQWCSEYFKKSSGNFGIIS